jgi:AraC family transcriptional regulator of adaptative response/methylated-DNA-[protein]-cysteine methyltransferase
VDERNAALVINARRAIDESDEELHLDDLARAAGLSTFFFHRQFKALTGLTPKAYASAHRARKVREELIASGRSVTDVIYDSGFGSSGRFYGSADRVLGLTPTAFRHGGDGTNICFAVGECSLRSILVAASERGVCAIQFGDDPEQLVRGLQDRFRKANLLGGEVEFEELVARVVAFVESPGIGLELPLDIRGTVFQHRVWQAIREIPAGKRASYSEIAARIGSPRAVRAVAGACAANELAVAIPCHRVVRTDGSLSGYRWGLERKRTLLQRESNS